MRKVSGRPSDFGFVPYGRQSVDDADLAAVAAALYQPFLTTGPLVERFEAAVAARLSTPHAVAVSSGTAALHLALRALDVGPGDEVIVPAMTFAATATSVVLCGGRPVVVDVDPDTLLIDVSEAAAAVTPRTRAIIAVDYAGQPSDYDALDALARRHDIALVSDACHSLGATQNGRPASCRARLTALSFHPVKHITTGEGGMVAVQDDSLAGRIRSLRNHGIDRGHADRTAARTWEYDVTEIGYNYRLTDLQCALGLSQLEKLDAFLARRRALAAAYDAFFDSIEGITPLENRAGEGHARHLYVVRVDPQRLPGGRDGLFQRLHARGIGANVHYKPLHRLSALRPQIALSPGGCPCADQRFEDILSLPLFPDLTDAAQTTVMAAVADFVAEAARGAPPKGAP